MSAFKKLISLTGALVGFSLVTTALPGEAFAQLQYGPWRKTGECRPASPPVGPGRGGVRLPKAVGGSGAEECKWERDVTDCPRLRDKIRHPIQCTRRKDKTGYTVFPPSN